MSKRRVRIVVIVRCPLCGSWIVGTAYSAHVESTHLSGPHSVSKPLRAESDVGTPLRQFIPVDELPELIDKDLEGVDEDGQRISGAAARAILNELGRRMSQGQDASLAFELYE